MCKSLVELAANKVASLSIKKYFEGYDPHIKSYYELNETGLISALHEFPSVDCN